MPIVRVTCDQCGLCATYVQSGDRGVASFDADEGEARCKKGREVKCAGESSIASVAACEHLVATLRPWRTT